MKSLKLVLFLSLAIVLGSCSSDDDGSNPDRLTEENFFGKYDLTSYKSKEVRTIKDDEDLDPYDLITEKEGDYYKMSYDFQESGKLVRDGLYTYVERKRRGDGEPTEKTKDENKRDEELNYSLDLDEKKVLFDGREYEIKNFSSSGFTLNYSNEEEKDGGNESVETNEEMKFERKS